MFTSYAEDTLLVGASQPSIQQLLHAIECICCHISTSVMEDPVATIDGNVYDRQYIEQWFRNCVVVVIIIVIVIIIGQCFWLALSVKGQQGVDVFLQQLKSQRIKMPIASSSP